MVTLSIPGFSQKELCLQHLVLDFNGTLAIDGKLISGVKEKLLAIAEKLQLHVLTGDTFGTAEEQLKGLACKLVLLDPYNQSAAKGDYVSNLGKDAVISIGNGNNDRQMLNLSAIGIIVLQSEGASSATLQSADILCADIFDALNLINNPQRMVATLRC